MYTIEKSWDSHLQLINLVSKEEGITTTSNSEDSTIEHNNQCNTIERKFAYLIPDKEAPVKTEDVQAIKDQCVELAFKEKSKLQEEEFLNEYTFMLQREILENELQEISSILGEEDKQMDMLNEELQIITSEPKYEEQFEGALKDIIVAMLVKGALKCLMEEAQKGSLPMLSQDK